MDVFIYQFNYSLAQAPLKKPLGKIILAALAYLALSIPEVT